MPDETPKDEKQTLHFRREALEERDALEQYDKSITIVRPKGWVVLAAIVVLIGFALIWSIFGRVSVTVQGQGILLRGGMVAQIVAESSGKIHTLLVKPGDEITEGQQVAVIDQPELEVQMQDLKAQVKQAQDDYDEARAAAHPDPTTVGNAQASLRAAQQQLREAETSLKTASEVVSSWEGTVTSFQAFAGQYVTPGAPIMTIEPPASYPLYADLYFPAGDGKKVENGMAAQIIPATMKVEEYGFLVGTVVYVANMPSTPQDMTALLQNELLVQQFSMDGPPILVMADPRPDPANPSGYAWSSSQGPPRAPSSGTECTALVVISRQAPITYLFPALGRFFDDGE